jgi:hypothetical protein
MSCQRATDLLTESVKQTAVTFGENWTRALAVKVNGVHGMSYWNEQDRQRFEPDYQFLASVIRYPEKHPSANLLRTNCPLSVSSTSDTPSVHFDNASDHSA